MKIKWSNFPVPEPFIVALLIAGLLQLIIPIHLLPPSTVWFPAGLIMLIMGAAVTTWAVFVAGDNNMEHPTSLTTSGPYAFSRNPMYLSWAIITLGLALLWNSLWLAIAMLGALIFVQVYTIPAEERALQCKFGVEYETYRKCVRRWL
jgi:protein-S-isoprenylcysteine O-methyltransferase Ste14